MDIKNIKIQQQTEINKTVVTYSKSEVEELIKSDMLKNGYIVKDISIITDSKYIEDEWGMNRHLTTFLDKIQVTVNRQKEDD